MSTIGDEANETFSLTFEDCVTTANCFSLVSDVGNCTVQYGQDPSYEDLGPPIIAPLNSSFTLPGLESSAFYYFQITFMVDSELEPIVQRKNFTTEGTYTNRK